MRYSMDYSSVPWLDLGANPQPPEVTPKLGWMNDAVAIDPFNSDRLLARIGDILKQEYGVAEWKMYRKHNAGVPAHQEIIEAIKTSADVVVAGIGD